jgi:hypothetical protein
MRSLSIQPTFLQNVGRGASVGIAIRPWPDGPDVDFRWGQIFPYPPRTTLGPIHPTVKWTPGLFLRGKVDGASR